MSTEGSSTLFQRCPRSLDRKRVRAFHRSLVEQVTEGKPFTCLVTRDAELQRLNQQFLGHDYPTDVLSFPGEPCGEVAISYDRAVDQAAEFGHPVESEIEILMLHGVLHLNGLDHERDRGRMARIEKKWRTQLGLPNGLIERTRK